jgi:hypothetical protein
MSRYVRIMKTGPVKPLFEKFKFMRPSSPEKYGGSYLKNAWAEVPELLFGAPYFIGGIGLMCYLWYKNSNGDYFTNRPYKPYYTIMRPDDPRVDRIKSEFYDRCEKIHEAPKHRSEAA